MLSDSVTRIQHSGFHPGLLWEDTETCISYVVNSIMSDSRSVPMPDFFHVRFFVQMLWSISTTPEYPASYRPLLHCIIHLSIESWL